MAGMAGLGLLASFGMQAIPLSRQVDDKWTLQEQAKNAGEEQRDVEMQVADLSR